MYLSIPKNIETRRDRQVSLDHIHIFKTNIGQADLALVKKLFNPYRTILSWSVDTEDCDLVLRVVSVAYSESQVRALVLQNGFECEVLS
ncbi:hypothetical protein [Flavobacterium caeni]|uniref:Uncharacterized protein n=1 Tax=Flavobacterium caeni TaxID=490189 RepID=A0A1G5AU08_9FLAO|nr:hypothetical protein [Flavobacterium caeni]SCX81356.1 hypothetical protein SAMN02927903_00153 [Flavobacterium caeni]